MWIVELNLPIECTIDISTKHQFVRTKAVVKNNFSLMAQVKKNLSSCVHWTSLFFMNKSAWISVVTKDAGFVSFDTKCQRAYIIMIVRCLLWSGTTIQSIQPPPCTTVCLSGGSYNMPNHCNRWSEKNVKKRCKVICITNGSLLIRSNRIKFHVTNDIHPSF